MGQNSSYHMESIDILKKYPYECRIKNTDISFIPTMIDYGHQMVWHGRADLLEKGKWIDFEDVIFTRNPTFKNFAPNKLITIGFLGVKKSYLNISQEESIKRYCEEDNIKKLYGESIDDFEFDDEFDCYEVWSKD